MYEGSMKCKDLSGKRDLNADAHVQHHDNFLIKIRHDPQDFLKQFLSGKRDLNADAHGQHHDNFLIKIRHDPQDFGK